jgi:predicted nucleic acid-binding protein
MHSAVVNTTPIIALNSIGRLDLLEKMYSKIYIPYAVYEEACVDGDDVMDRNLLLSFSNFSIERISNNEAKTYFRTALHKGEVETMILANELGADLCIIDDQLARNYAKVLGLTVTGTLGVLVKAKENGFIEKVTPLMDNLIQNGIYIGNKLYTDIRRITGE